VADVARPALLLREQTIFLVLLALVLVAGSMSALLKLALAAVLESQMVCR
jgi:hypothetical protein